MTLKARTETLPAPQRRLWPELRALADRFVLYGGTAIALRLGHRTSVDFDFFTDEPVDPDHWLQSVGFLRNCDVLQLEPNSLTVSIDRGGPVKVSLFGDITFGRVGQPDQTDDGVAKVASLLDLLATKLKVLLQRVEVKDYLDIEALLRANVSLQDGLGAAQTLYGNGFPPMECVKALTYFVEGESRRVPEPTQRYLQDLAVHWQGDVHTLQLAGKRLC